MEKQQRAKTEVAAAAAAVAAAATNVDEDGLVESRGDWRSEKMIPVDKKKHWVKQQQPQSEEYIMLATDGSLANKPPRFEPSKNVPIDNNTSGHNNNNNNNSSFSNLGNMSWGGGVDLSEVDETSFSHLDADLIFSDNNNDNNDNDNDNGSAHNTTAGNPASPRTKLTIPGVFGVATTATITATVATTTVMKPILEVPHKVEETREDVNKKLAIPSAFSNDTQDDITAATKDEPINKDEPLAQGEEEEGQVESKPENGNVDAAVDAETEAETTNNENKCVIDTVQDDEPIASDEPSTQKEEEEEEGQQQQVESKPVTAAILQPQMEQKYNRVNPIVEETKPMPNHTSLIHKSQTKTPKGSPRTLLNPTKREQPSVITNKEDNTKNHDDPTTNRAKNDHPTDNLMNNYVNSPDSDLSSLSLTGAKDGTTSVPLFAFIFAILMALLKIT